MPFGLRNATNFPKIHGSGATWDGVHYVYIDDVLIASSTPQEHKKPAYGITTF